MTNLENLPALTAEFFNRAGHDDELSERMSFADTVVHLHFTDLPAGKNVCTVWLDRNPICGEVGAVGSAEIELYAPSKIYGGLFAGKEALPIAIVRGDVEYKGPVRKFLRVVPILASFDYGMFKDSSPSVGGAIPSSAG